MLELPDPRSRYSIRSTTARERGLRLDGRGGRAGSVRGRLGAIGRGGRGPRRGGRRGRVLEAREGTGLGRCGGRGARSARRRGRGIRPARGGGRGGGRGRLGPGGGRRHLDARPGRSRRGRGPRPRSGGGGGGRPVRSAGGLDPHLEPGTARLGLADDPQDDGLPRQEAVEPVDQVVVGPDRSAVEGDDAIPGAKPRFRGRRAGHHLEDTGRRRRGPSPMRRAPSATSSPIRPAPRPGPSAPRRPASRRGPSATGPGPSPGPRPGLRRRASSRRG